MPVSKEDLANISAILSGLIAGQYSSQSPEFVQTVVHQAITVYEELQKQAASPAGAAAGKK